MARHRPLTLINMYPYRKLMDAYSKYLGTIHKFYIPPIYITDKKIKSIMSFIFYFPVFISRFFGFTERMNIRVVNFHNPTISVLTVLLGRIFVSQRIKVFLSFHGTDLLSVTSSKNEMLMFWKCIFNHCDAIITVSSKQASDLGRLFPAICSKLHTINNGVDIAACEIAALSGELPEELSDKKYIACVGTFDLIKGQDILVKAFQKLAATMEEVNLVLVGRSGANLDKITQLVQDASCRDRIYIYPDMGHAATLAVISRAELFVLPSRQEAFGLVILEAGALETPVIASQVGGIPEIIIDGKTGVLVPPEAPKALQIAMVSCLNDRQKARAYAKNLKKHISKNFTWDKVLETYGTLLSKMS